MTLTPTLAAYWNFDQTTGTPGLDTSNRSIKSNGTPIGAQLQPGFYMHSLQFSGSGQYFNVPRTANLEPTNGLTLSMWVYPTQINSGKQYVLLNKGSTSHDYMLYINSNGFLVFHIQSLAALNVTPVATSTATPSPIAPNKTSDIVGPQLPLNAWTHIAASYDPNAGLMKLYLNGTLAASMWVTGTVAYNTSYGITLSDPTNPFYGMMDEVSIYGAALSDSQIQSLSKSDFHRYTKANLHPNCIEYPHRIEYSDANRISLHQLESGKRFPNGTETGES